MLFSFFLFPHFCLLHFCIFSISVLPPFSKFKPLCFFLLRYDLFLSFFYLIFLCFSSIRDLHFSFFFLMCDYFEVKHHCLYVSFLFAYLGAFLKSNGGCPKIGPFTPRGSALKLVLADLSPLLRQSLDWFRSI